MIRHPRDNLHAHFFSVDHTPPAQFYYLLIEYLARGLWHPTQYEREHPTDTERRLERGAPCILLQLLLVWIASCVCASLLRRDLEGLIRMATRCSHVTEDAAKRALGLETDFRLRRFLECVWRLGGEETPRWRSRFAAGIAAVAKNLHAAHERERAHRGVLTHRELYARYVEECRAVGVAFDRVVLLTVDLDHAFTRVALPYGLSGRPALDFDAQLAEVEALVAEVNTPTRDTPEIIPFLGIDPRRFPDGDALVAWAERRLAPTGCFRGVKLYPSMGFAVADLPRRLFELCRERGLPVTAHATRFGAGARGQAAQRRSQAAPMRWRPVLRDLVASWDGDPTRVLRVNLAHFSELHERTDPWVEALLELMLEFDGSGGVMVFSDISNDVVIDPAKQSRYRANARRILRLGLGDRVLFGTDWWNNLPASEHEAFYLANQRFDVDEGPFPIALLDRAARRFLP
jgi:predicted TIM-barrel fold metal-dependent hydrolase